MSSQSRFAARPQADQHARDDRAVDLNFNAFLRLTQQMAAAKNVFQKSEEDFNCPPVTVEQRDDLGRDIQQVVAMRRNPSQF